MDEPDFKLGRVGFCWGTIRRAELRRRSAPCVTSCFQCFQGATLAAHMFSVRDYCRWSAQAPRGSCGGLRQVQKMFKWHTGKSSGVRLALLTHLFSLFQYTSGPQSCRLCRLGKGKRRVMDLAAQHAVLWRRQIAVGFSCSGTAGGSFVLPGILTYKMERKGAVFNLFHFLCLLSSSNSGFAS